MLKIIVGAYLIINASLIVSTYKVIFQEVLVKIWLGVDLGGGGNPSLKGSPQ